MVMTTSNRSGSLFQCLLKNFDGAKSSSWVVLTRSPTYMFSKKGSPNHLVKLVSSKTYFSISKI